MKAGDKVKFADPQDAHEQTLIMTVLEDRGDRVLVETPVDGMYYTPQHVYAKADLVLA